MVDPVAYLFVLITSAAIGLAINYYLMKAAVKNGMLSAIEEADRRGLALPTRSLGPDQASASFSSQVPLRGPLPGASLGVFSVADALDQADHLYRAWAFSRHPSDMAAFTDSLRGFLPGLASSGSTAADLRRRFPKAVGQRDFEEVASELASDDAR